MKHINRREFIKQSTVAAVLLSNAVISFPAFAVPMKSPSVSKRKLIVIGFDGMDPYLCERMMAQGRLPHLAAMRAKGGYRLLKTSHPPQSPVVWASFINGAGPGSHGIFDFIHRDPQKQVEPYFSAADTLQGAGYFEIGNHKLQLDFWPFNHRLPQTILKRQGTPFWEYLDRAGISSTFYDLPSNYPPSPSRYGNHRCLAGMGTPDLLGSYGTFQHFAEQGPEPPVSKGGGQEARIYFDGDTSRPLKLTGPLNTMLKTPVPTCIDFQVHRDRRAQAAVIEIQGKTLVLKKGEWSEWQPLEFGLSAPAGLPKKNIAAICRFYLQEVAPNFRLYVSPINADPMEPALRLSEPMEFSREMADKLGLFHTTGFQEDHKALSRGIFSENEFIQQAGHVLAEREQQLNYALDNHDDGLLFFYFSSTDLQGHMLWWDSAGPHPARSAAAAGECFQHLQRVYMRMDAIVGDLLKRCMDNTHLIVMSDHGFANFRRQFNLNAWLQKNGYLGPSKAASILTEVDWESSRAFGLGMNGLYLNLKGREKYGIVETGEEKENLMNELITRLESVQDADGNRIIKKVRRSDQIFSGSAMESAPDLIVGYHREYRASWKTVLGEISEDILLDNTSAWGADHCLDASEVPGVLFSSMPISVADPCIEDLAPSILNAFDLGAGPGMTGRNIFSAF